MGSWLKWLAKLFFKLKIYKGKELKVIVPKKTYTKDIVISAGGKKKPLEDIFFLPDNILFDASFLIPPVYDNSKSYKLGDVCFVNSNRDKVKIAIAQKQDGTLYWLEEDYDGWNIVKPYNFKAVPLDTSPIYKDNFYFKYDSDASATKIYRAREDGNKDNLQEIYDYKIDLSDYDEIVFNKFPVWDSSKTYDVGDIVSVMLVVKKEDGITIIEGDILFKSLSGQNNTNPIDNPLKWERLPFNSQLAMFDRFLNTEWKFNNQLLNMDFSDTTDIDNVVLLNAKGTKAKITFKNSEVEKEIEYDLKSRTTSSFYDYFYEDFKIGKSIVAQTPIIYTENVNIQIKGDNNSLSTCILGKGHYIGKALYGYKKQSRDFSKKQTTQAGLDYLQKGMQTKKYIVKLIIHNDEAPRIFDLLQSLSTTLCVYVLEDGEFVFGWYKDLYMTKSNPVFSEYELEINGVI